MEILKLRPAIKDYIWGGTKLKKDWQKEWDGNSIAECWELSLHKDGESIVANEKFALKKLSEVIDKSHYGTNCDKFTNFPVLIKLIDTNENLSIQVHPSDDALKNENQFGKTEIWYIADCDENAGIYFGFKKDISKEEFAARISDNSLEEILNFIEVKKGESYFIPSGMVHAICKGITVCEIQQNSNLTYRIYDYKRLGPDGKPRDLHIEKAKAVSILDKFKPENLAVILDEETKRLCNCKYFTVYEYNVKSGTVINADKKSFNSVTFLSGSGLIENSKFKKGDTYFIAAGYGDYKIKGECKFLMTKINKFYIGIDLGGTNIKGGLINDEGSIIVSEIVKTESYKGPDAVIDNIISLVKLLLQKSGMSYSDIEGVGLCSPGLVNSKEGIVIYSNNLKWENVHIVKRIENELGIKARITNDANAAALGEAKFGASKDFDNSVFITLGTGVGGGIIINGKLYEGNQSAGAEIGHIVISVDGEKCTCGRLGCFESYASATGLIRETKKAMEKNKNSLMWKIAEGNLDNVSGKTAFLCYKQDAAAKAVVENYIKALGEGLTNIANLFRPDVIILGGGVSKEGDNLIVPLQKFVDKHIYAQNLGPRVPIKIAALGNNAGFFGAAALFEE